MIYGKIEELFSLKGKKVLITGGTKGLGKALAIGFLENGCDVFITSRNIDDIDDIEEVAAENNTKLFAFPCDVTNPSRVEEMVRNADILLGGVDILINSAGIAKLKMVWELDFESWNSVINTNINAMFLVTKAMVPILKQSKSARIINISSMKSILGTSDAGYSAYCASKGAVNMFTKQIACELARFNINCNAVAPTFIKTSINAEQLDNQTFRESLEARIPLGRIGQLNDLFSLAAFLASDASSFITGQVILLDGGINARQ